MTIPRRARIYARYSSLHQKATSIEDQEREMRALADRLGGLEVTGVYSDSELSGFAAANRPGLQQLWADARAGAFDVVLAESLDRLSRSQGDTGALFEELRFLGIEIITQAEGVVGAMAVAFRGAANAEDLQRIAQRVRRGQRGALARGRVNATPMGYRLRREVTEAGDLVRGLRTIDAGQADLVRRIYALADAGMSDRAIAMLLNAEGVPSARGAGWLNTSVAHVLSNPIYNGVVLWGRTTAPKNPRSGKRSVRAAPAGDVLRVEREDLRIVERALWERVQTARLGRSSAVLGRPERARRPKRLLSGVLVCGDCGEAMVVTGSRGDARRFRCSTRFLKGSCQNSRSPLCEEVEGRVVASVRHRLLRPEAVEAAVHEVRRLLADANRAGVSERARVTADLVTARRRAGVLVGQVADGVLEGRTVAGHIRELELQISALEARRDAFSALDTVVELHPAAAGHYRTLVEDLAKGLEGDAAPHTAARDAFRRLIGRVVLTPQAEHGAYALEIVCDPAQVLSAVTGVTLPPSEAAQLRLPA